MPDLSVLSGDDISAAQDALHDLKSKVDAADNAASFALTAAQAAADAKSAADAASDVAVAAVKNIFDKVAGDDETIIYQGNVVSIVADKVVLTPAVILN